MSTEKAPGQTGNPVFDYRAGFRRAAGAVQRLLLQAGLLVILISLPPALAGGMGPVTQAAALWSLGLGLVLTGAGLLWGFGWRRWLRLAFQREYGPSNK